MSGGGLKKIIFHYVGWFAALAFTWYAVRCWAEVRSLGFGGVSAVKAVCATFICSILWIDILIMEKRRRRLISQDALKVACSKCGYDLRGAPVPRCPECGCLRGFDKTAEELGIELPARSTDAEDHGAG